MEQIPANPPELKRGSQTRCSECDADFTEDEKKERCPKCLEFLCAACASYCFVNGVTTCWACQEEAKEESEGPPTPILDVLKCRVCGHAGDAQCDCWVVYSNCSEVFSLPEKQKEL